MNTNMTGFGCFAKNFALLCFGRNKPQNVMVTKKLNKVEMRNKNVRNGTYTKVISIGFQGNTLFEIFWKCMVSF